jgi:auxin responsive GH3 family protein
VGVNTSPLATPYETTFTIVPTFAYFEFLPLDNQSTDQQANDDASKIVGIGDVEVGKEYEIIITTYGGKNHVENNS